MTFLNPTRPYSRPLLSFHPPVFITNFIIREAAEHFLASLSMQQRGLGPQDGGKSSSVMSESIWKSLQHAVAFLGRNDLHKFALDRDIDSLTKELDAMVWQLIQKKRLLGPYYMDTSVRIPGMACWDWWYPRLFYAGLCCFTLRMVSHNAHRPHQVWTVTYTQVNLYEKMHQLYLWLCTNI